MGTELDNYSTSVDASFLPYVGYVTIAMVSCTSIVSAFGSANRQLMGEGIAKNETVALLNGRRGND